MATYEELPGFPATGALPIPISPQHKSGAWSGHSEGKVVRFRLDSGDAWVANFQPGSGGYDGVLSHPDQKRFIVVAAGRGYVVDPHTRSVSDCDDVSIYDVIRADIIDAIILCYDLYIEAIGRGGVIWKTPRISWDEMKDIQLHGTILTGFASFPGDPESSWSEFHLDIKTGVITNNPFNEPLNGSYHIRRL